MDLTSNAINFENHINNPSAYLYTSTTKMMGYTDQKFVESYAPLNPPNEYQFRLWVYSSTTPGPSVTTLEMNIVGNDLYEAEQMLAERALILFSTAIQLKVALVSETTYSVHHALNDPR